MDEEKYPYDFCLLTGVYSDPIEPNLASPRYLNIDFNLQVLSLVCAKACFQTDYSSNGSNFLRILRRIIIQ